MNEIERCCSFCKLLKDAHSGDYGWEAEWDYPIKITNWGIDCDDGEYCYSASIEWNYCPVCAKKVEKQVYGQV